MSNLDQPLQGLEQLHQLISGLLISSADAGELVKTLSLLINPIKVKEKDLTRLSIEEKSLLLCVYKNDANEFLDTCSYAHKHLIHKDCAAYYASGLTGFPLPKWPFFLAEGPLDPITHFVNYVSAYHPDYTGHKLNSRTMCICNDTSFLLVGYDKSSKSFVCSTYSLGGDSSLTFYSLEMGALCIKISPLKSTQGKPILSSIELPFLQYEGKLKCFEINQLKGQMHCCSTFYIQKSSKAHSLSSSLLKISIKNISHFENLDDALRSQLLIQEDFLK